MKVGVVIVCAGRGVRFGKKDKSTLSLSGKRLFSHSLETFASIKQIKQIVLVFRKCQLSRIRGNISDKRVVLVAGGARRKDSVYNGLLALGRDIDSVLIHDGARPFVSRKSILKLIKALKKNPAVILGQKAIDTLKLVEKGCIKRTVQRDNIFCAQTPQGFRKDLILKAYQQLNTEGVTDDAQVVEFFGKKVKVIEGDYCNIKITYPEDIALAESILRKK